MDSNVSIPAFLSVIGFGLVIVAGMFTATPSTVRPMSSSSSIPTKEKPKRHETERYHVSKTKIDKLYSGDPGFEFALKPEGLWYAFTKTRWIEFARSIMKDAFKKDEVVYLYRLKFTKPSNILIIDTLNKAKDLCKQLVSSTDRTYNWNKIKKQGYDGVEIYDDVLKAIFKAERSDCLNMLRFFDISSGCLWNVDNVQVELIETIKIK
jgi:hypothetical protein